MWMIHIVALIVAEASTGNGENVGQTHIPSAKELDVMIVLCFFKK